jgi:hypothetical protein
VTLSRVIWLMFSAPTCRMIVMSSSVMSIAEDRQSRRDHHLAPVVRSLWSSFSVIR